MRVIKTQADIDEMKEAGRITEAAFADTLKTLRLGMTELEIVEEVNYQCGNMVRWANRSRHRSTIPHPIIHCFSGNVWRAGRES